jgi:hypothetical protein
MAQWGPHSQVYVTFLFVVISRPNSDASPFHVPAMKYADRLFPGRPAVTTVAKPFL